MRILTITGLAMVSAVALAPAAAQRIGHPMMPPPGGSVAAPLPPQPMAGAPGGGQPGVTWNHGGNWNGGQPRIGGDPRTWSPTTPRPGVQVGGDPRTWSRTGGGQWNGGRGNRWGGNINGHWSGGWNAPGGWNAYHRPSRGWTLPRYWIAPSFYINDWSDYGLASPPAGYNWSRYYDDAVLVDNGGRVWDTVGGVDWNRYDDGDAGYSDGGYGYQAGYAAQGYPQPGYAPPPPPPPPPPPRIDVRPMQEGYTTTVYANGTGYAAGGYWMPPATTTVVTIQSPPIVTTTTTTETVTETRYVTKRIYRAPVRRWRPPARHCTCRVPAPRILGS